MTRNKYTVFQGLTLVDNNRHKQPASNNPAGNSIRIFPDGSVYPGLGLVEEYDLVYRNDENGKKRGVGIDIIDSGTWDKFKDLPRVILAAVVPRSEPKIELFSSYKSNSNNVPLSTVLIQGAKSELLLRLVKELGYMTETQAYCDLTFLDTTPIKSADGIFYVPKLVEKGTRKGEMTYERRENIVFYPLIPLEEYAEVIASQPTETTVVNEVIAVN